MNEVDSMELWKDGIMAVWMVESSEPVRERMMAFEMDESKVSLEVVGSVSR